MDSKEFNFDDFVNKTTEFKSKCNYLLNEFKEPTTSNNKLENFPKEKLGLQLFQLSQITKKLHYRLKGPIVDNSFNDSLIEVFKFLTRKQLYNSVQLTNKHFYNVVKANEEIWSKYKFGRFAINTDTYLNQSSKYCSFKNYKELSIPPQELSPILATLSTNKCVDSRFSTNGRLIKPIKMLTSHDGNTSPEDVYFFFNINEKSDNDGCECCTKCECCQFIDYLPKRKFDKFYIYLPNLLTNRLTLASAIFWFRQFSKHRWTKEFLINFLIQFGLNKFLPIVTDDFRSYQPVSMPFLQKTLMAKSISIWDIKGNVDFYNYLINKEGNNKNNNNGIRTHPESLTVFGFVPQITKFNGDEQEEWDNIFDALIKHCLKTRNPNQIIAKINLNFGSRPAPWIHTNITGMKLIYRSTTFKIDEDGTESETIEVRYSLLNMFDSKKRFEIRLECNSNGLNRLMTEFTLIRETSED